MHHFRPKYLTQNPHGQSGIDPMYVKWLQRNLGTVIRSKLERE